MARIPLNPTELKRLRKQLSAFRRVLPSLDLKRKQVALHLATERAALAGGRTALAELESTSVARLPMLAGETVRLNGLVRVRAVDVRRELVAGVAIPALRAIDLGVEPYGRIATPHWVDGYVEALSEVVRSRVGLALRERRVAVLDLALRKATQRVNLLEKLLIPRTLSAARRIEVFLADAQRTEIVRAKLAKARAGGAP